MQDDVNLQSITLLELVQLYYSCDLPFPLNLELSFQSNRFIARYNAIKSEIDAQADAEADEGGSEVDEEEEGEEGEQAMEPEGDFVSRQQSLLSDDALTTFPSEPHHSVQRTEIEDVGQPGDEEDSGMSIIRHCSPAARTPLSTAARLPTQNNSNDLSI